MAIGTGDSPVTAADVELVNEAARVEFDKNNVVDEKTANITLKGRKEGKDILRLESRFSGEDGNKLAVEVSPDKDDTVNIFITDGRSSEEATEEFIGVNMNKKSKYYAVNMINKESDLVTATFV